VSGRGYIAPEADGKCQICGIKGELRPYGPNKEEICFDCGMKDPEGTKRRMTAYLYGDNDEIKDVYIYPTEPS
jgi:hypothetical protein